MSKLILPPRVVQKKLKAIISKAMRKSRKTVFSCFIDECKKKAIASHSQSLSKVLKNIAEHGFVISANRGDPFKIRDINSFFGKIGIRKASRFKGFCGKHDSRIFGGIDTINNIMDMDFTKELLAMISFRTFGYEERTKEKYYLLMKYIYEKAKMIMDDDQKDILSGVTYGIKNHLDVTKPYYMKKFIGMFESRDYDPIKGLIFRIDKKIPISCSTAIDLQMIKSGDFMKNDINQPLDICFFNVLPQIDSSLVILSYFEEQRSMFQKFISSFLDLENIIFNHCEEVLMKPSFYSSLDYDLKKQIVNGLSPWVNWERVDFPNFLGVKMGNPLEI